MMSGCGLLGLHLRCRKLLLVRRESFNKSVYAADKKVYVADKKVYVADKKVYVARKCMC